LVKNVILQKLKDAAVNFDIETVREACRDALDEGIPAYEIVMEDMAKGMEVVGKKYESGEFFLSELIMAGETVKEGMKIIEPHLASEGAKARGKIVIGTV